jgi:hypothetical protein
MLAPTLHRLSPDNQQNGADDYEDNEHDGEHQRRRNRASMVRHTLL